MMGLSPLSMKGPPMEKARLSDSDLHSPPDFPFSCRVCSFSVSLDHPVRVYSEHGSWTASTKRPEVPHTSPRRSAISSSVRILFSIVSLLFYSVFLTPSESFADPFRDFILYSYQTPEQGEVSVGTWQTLLLPNKTTDTLYGKNIRNANLLFSTYVLEFGVTDWWTMGAYIDFSAGAGQTYSYLQTRAITTRLRFPKIPDFVDPAVQIEYWVPGGGTGMQSFLDIILIAEKKIGPFLFDINPKFLFPTDGSQPNYPPVFSYAAGAYYLLAKNVNAGIEFFGDSGPINNMGPMGGPPGLYNAMQQQFVFQSWNFAIGEHIDGNIGVGTGLTPVSAPFAAKIIFEYHFKPFYSK